MSNIIPGAYNTEREQMIAKMMEAKREPVRRLEGDIEKNDIKIESLSILKKNVGELSNTLKNLFSFDNPFSLRGAKSSDEAILSAVAKRNSELKTYSFKVLQVAQNDSFLSKNILEDYSVAKGKYSFDIGKDKVSFDFEGGSLEAFSTKLNNKNQDILSSKIVNISKNNKVFVLTAKKTGLANKMIFKDDSIKLGLDLDLIKQAGKEDNKVDFNIATAKNLATDNENFQLSKDDLQLNDFANTQLDFNKNLKIEQNSKILIRLDIEKAEGKTTNIEDGLENLIVDSDSVTMRNITIKNAESVYGQIPSDYGQNTEPQSKPVLTLNISTDSGKRQLPDFFYVEGQSEYTLNFDTQDMGNIATSLDIKNNSNLYSIKIKSIEITKENNEDEISYEPVKATTVAQDAIVNYEGIDFNRDKNIIDDIVSDLTLNVKKSDENEMVQVRIEADKGNITDYIIKFVSDYNRAVRDINIYTSNVGRAPEVIASSMFQNKEEEQDAQKRVSLFQSETTLINMKNSMRTIVSESYPTLLGSDFAILDDAGISTNPNGSSNLNPQVLYGYLNVDPKKLEATLDTKLNALKEIFGKDTDGDLIVDTGVAFKLNDFLSQFLMGKSPLSSRTDTLKSENDRNKEKIENYKKEIENFERKLRTDLIKMDQASKQLEQSTKQIDNFFPKNN